jgi:prolipoprotein diacylglyceryltransferase
MLYVGICAGIVTGTWAASLRGLDPFRVQAAMLLLVVPALAGARLLFVASNWHIYRGDLRRIWRRSEAGASLYGGLALSFAVSLLLLPIAGLPIAAFWDATAVTMATAMIFTKIGCLLNGCCEGRPTDAPVGLHLPDINGQWRRRWPTQLLESGVAAFVLASALIWWNRDAADGSFALFAYGTYAAARLWLETKRATIERVGPWSLHRAISGVLVGLACTGFVFLWMAGR